jgi:hypothetical protein
MHMPDIDDQTRMRPSETLAEFAQRLKEIGKKPLVFAVDDDSDPAYEERIRTQSVKVSRSKGDKDVDDFGEEVIADTMSEEPPFRDDP